MFARLKNLIRPPAPAVVAEYVHAISAEARTGLEMDVRYLLSHVVHAEEFPLLAQLDQTTRGQFGRIHIPLSTLPKLAREIETVRHKLPAKSPLLQLAESAGKCRGMDLVLASAEKNAEAAGAPGQPVDAEAAPPNLTASEQVRMLKSAADDVDVSFVSTSELGESAQAAYFKYCLGMGEYDKVIADLMPRAPSAQRVWVWSLLVAAMRLSNHADFTAAVTQFHAWLEVHHPETLNDLTTAAEERRKFNGEKIAAIEAQELAPH